MMEHPKIIPKRQGKKRPRRGCLRHPFTTSTKLYDRGDGDEKNAGHDDTHRETRRNAST